MLLILQFLESIFSRKAAYEKILFCVYLDIFLQKKIFDIHDLERTLYKLLDKCFIN